LGLKIARKFSREYIAVSSLPVLTFRKGGHTTEFPAAFMRHEVGELERFPKEGAVNISVDLIRTLSRVPYLFGIQV